MPATATTRRAELYLRGDTYGTFDAQQSVLNRIQALESGGTQTSEGNQDSSEAVLDESRVAGEWQRIRTLDEETRSEAIETYHEFAEWAERNDHSLSPAFERRTRSFVGLDRVDEVVVFPVVSLAIYEDEQLRAVFPCSDGDDNFSVPDCLDAFERGDESWLAQFDGVTVDRTAPRLDAGLEA